MHRLLVVVPTLNEAPRIEALLAQLQAARAAGAQVVVVDGGSEDGTRSIALPLADSVLTSAPGRGAQIAAGIAAADHPYLWLLHADSRIAGGHAAAVVRALDSGAVWGRFDIRIDGASPLLRLVGVMMNLRTRATGIVTGDHGLFCRRAALDRAGGYPPQPLMEDIEVSRRLRALGWPLAIGPLLGTSARRWENRGVLRTIFSMWRFRLRYFLGTPPEVLAREYYTR